jgi:hypothetical protein
MLWMQAIFFAVWILFCLKVIICSLKVRLDIVCGVSELELFSMWHRIRGCSNDKCEFRYIQQLLGAVVIVLFPFTHVGIWVFM